MNCFDGTFSMGKAFALAGGVGKALRNVVNFNGVSQYAVAPRVEEIDLDDPDLEFEVEWTGGMNGTSTEYILHDGVNGAEATINLAVSYYKGLVRVVIGGTMASFTIPYNNFQTASFTFSESVVSLYIDGNLVGSAGAASVTTKSTETELTIGGRDNGDGSKAILHQGQLRDIKIWTGGDRDTGTLTRWYEMEEGWRGDNNQVLINKAAELGAELVVNGDFSDGLNGWTLVGNDSDGVNDIRLEDGALRVKSDNSKIVQAGQDILNIGVTYIGECEVLELGSADVVGVILFENIAPYFVARADGNYVEVFTSGTATTGIRRNFETDALVDNYSVRQADGYGKYVGLTEASWTEEIV